MSRRRRWITPEEIRELYERSVKLLETRGLKQPDGEVQFSGRHQGVEVSVYKCLTSGIALEHTINVADIVAGVATFDADTGAVKEIFGSTALNALDTMRKLMVLDDVANV